MRDHVMAPPLGAPCPPHEHRGTGVSCLWPASSWLVTTEGLLGLLLQMFDLIIIPSFFNLIPRIPPHSPCCLPSPAAPAVAGVGEVQRIGKLAL